MFYNKKLYKSIEWIEFSQNVKKRDNYKCLKCGNGSNSSILQVHHTEYINGKKPWEYLLSSCITLCKVCHAKVHNKIEPTIGWELISIEDLGSMDGNCEKKGCNSPIRYLHEIYHPDWGYKIVGSTCVEYLTEADKIYGKNTIKLLNKVRSVYREVKWYKHVTKNSAEYVGFEYKGSEARIYNNNSILSLQFCVKEKGFKRRDFSDFYSMGNLEISKVKELAVVGLLGNITEDILEKKILRNIYLTIKNSNEKK